MRLPEFMVTPPPLPCGSSPAICRNISQWSRGDPTQLHLLLDPGARNMGGTLVSPVPCSVQSIELWHQRLWPGPWPRPSTSAPKHFSPACAGVFGGGDPARNTSSKALPGLRETPREGCWALQLLWLLDWAEMRRPCAEWSGTMSCPKPDTFRPWSWVNLPD